MLIRGPLTDRKIEEYRQRGYYSDAFRAARRDVMARKVKRVGSYDLVDGRMIYRLR